MWGPAKSLINFIPGGKLITGGVDLIAGAVTAGKKNKKNKKWGGP